MANRARSLDVQDDIEVINEYAYEQGWTDGLPIIPPTPARVEAMMRAVDRRPDDIIAHLPPLRAAATVEKIAISAVMAWCRPDYFPVVLAAVEAAADPRLGTLSMNTTTNPTAPFVLVNGPVRNAIDMNCSWSVLGPRKRANATIGRALSLIMINLAGRLPEQTCKATWKMPGAFTMCAGEYEEESPWEPFHVDRGFKKDESTVTLMSPASAVNIVDNESQTPDELLANINAGMLSAGSNNVFPFYGIGNMGLMLCPGHARLLARQYGRRQLQEYFLAHLKLPASYLSPRRVAMMESAGLGQVEDGYVRYAARAEQFLIFVAGGPGGLHSGFFPTLGDSRAVTHPIRVPGA